MIGDWVFRRRGLIEIIKEFQTEGEYCAAALDSTRFVSLSIKVCKNILVVTPNINVQTKV